jgi:3-oxoacyl-[acyl-carrier protein] reductase
MRLEGKIAIITGAANGLGLEAARLFLKEGAMVALVDYDATTGEQRAAELQTEGEAAFYQVDVANQEKVVEMVSMVKERFGKIDILINNAGITKDNLLMRMSEEMWDDVININLKSCFNTVKAATKTMMKQRSGSIINMTSVVGIKGNAGQANYAASKAGIIGFTKSVAREVAQRGITVNALSREAKWSFTPSVASGDEVKCMGCSITGSRHNVCLALNRS